MFLLKTEQPYTEEDKFLEPASYSPAWTTNIIQKFVGIESKNVILIYVFRDQKKNIDNDALKSNKKMTFIYFTSYRIKKTKNTNRGFLTYSM